MIFPLRYVVEVNRARWLTPAPLLFLLKEAVEGSSMSYVFNIAIGLFIT